ncbi:hypothetical protein, partial [Lysobacter sp. TAB13]|uniref:hypothetical protein n=1 Tax=Lysobacter sp. TAB13 TaxID=3233065 RepID=UPI003F943BB1
VGGYSNPEVDKLFAEAAIAASDAQRQELYTKVQKLLVQAEPRRPLRMPCPAPASPCRKEEA